DGETVTPPRIASAMRYDPPPPGEGERSSPRIFGFNFQTAEGTCDRILAARGARGLHHIWPTFLKEGAGKAGCALHPRSRVQSAQKKAHTSIQVQRRQSGFPCAVVYGLLRALPGD